MSDRRGVLFVGSQFRLFLKIDSIAFYDIAVPAGFSRAVCNFNGKNGVVAGSWGKFFGRRVAATVGMRGGSVPYFDISVTAMVNRFLFHKFADADFASIQAYWTVIDLPHGFSVESLKTVAIPIFHEFVEGVGYSLFCGKAPFIEANVLRLVSYGGFDVVSYQMLAIVHHFVAFGDTAKFGSFSGNVFAGVFVVIGVSLCFDAVLFFPSFFFQGFGVG